MREPIAVRSTSKRCCAKRAETPAGSLHALVCRQALQQLMGMALDDESL